MERPASPRARNLVELLQFGCRRYANRPLLGTRRAGQWHWLSYREVGAMVDQARAGLAGLGVRPGERVAIVGDNSVEWMVAAYAVYGLGATFVAMHPAQAPHEWEFILRDCGARVVIAGSDAIQRALHAMRGALPELEHIVGLGSSEAAGSWRALIAAGAAAPVEPRSPDPDAIATFIYTPGTTGRPKGVRLSHRNLVASLEVATAVFAFTPVDRSVAFLPWVHIFVQLCDLHLMVGNGGSIALNDEPKRLFLNLIEVKPTFLVAVPRIFNRVYHAIKNELGGRADVVAETVHGKWPSTADSTRQMLLQTIRDRFGGGLRYAVCGSTALTSEVTELLEAAGISLVEGYGLTEAAAIVTTSTLGHRKRGSVGRVVRGVRIAIDDTVRGVAGYGEIVVYGPCVMAGYHDRPDDEKRAVMPDGGLRTGDLGRFDDDGFLYLAGRLEDQQQLDSGTYLAPGPLEDALRCSPYIANVMIYADGRPHSVALVMPEASSIRNWAEDHGIKLGHDLAAEEAVRQLIAAEIERLSTELQGFERPRAIAVLGQGFTVDNGLLTPTLRIRRREVVSRHRATLESLYAGHGVRISTPASSDTS
jgi:long-chain acyl-CoA synthetase